MRFLLVLLIVSNSGWLTLCLDCSFSSTYPRQMLAYMVEEGAISVDGKLNDPAWKEVDWSEDFVDISLDQTPRLMTRAKVRWSSEWLYVAAELEENQIWANISHTCHCQDAKVGPLEGRELHPSTCTWKASSPGEPSANGRPC